jgi:hypothetical protein
MPNAYPNPTWSRAKIYMQPDTMDNHGQNIHPRVGCFKKLPKTIDAVDPTPIIRVSALLIVSLRKN